ncbi:nucleotide excision repair endonuclease [Bacillus phage vB_BanS-Thrax2]|nr:nucleotide excision repair endonuclease [Bacillus phage vB_BanS-Thrax2]
MTLTSKFYVYRFLDMFDHVIYIGRTNDLYRRMTYEHFSTYGHLPQQCYDDCETIEFMELSSHSEMKVFELYLINKYNPRYNIMENRNDNFTFNLEEHWTEYKNNDIITKKEYKVYNYIVMQSDVGWTRTITTANILSEGLKIKNKATLWRLLESLERKGYISILKTGNTLIITHTLRNLEFPKEECQ